jgi:hypothetical protein
MPNSKSSSPGIATDLPADALTVFENTIDAMECVVIPDRLATVPIGLHILRLLLDLARFHGAAATLSAEPFAIHDTDWTDTANRVGCGARTLENELREATQKRVVKVERKRGFRALTLLSDVNDPQDDDEQDDAM